MDLVGAWLRQLLRAGTAAALVPVAMVAALVVVLIGAGGFGGLSSLRQVVAGPKVSPTQVAQTGRDTPAVTPRADRRRARPAPARPPRVAPQAPVTPPPATTPPPPVTPPPVTPPAPRPPPVVSTPPPPAPPPPPPEQVATPEKPAIEQTTQQLVDGVDTTLDTVGELLVAIINRLGRLLPPPR
ncbi:MAG: hypothetical protein QOE11_983 [Solirubrobacteraceae bacterium]|jgi:hypothetical protein|nr:hypothetical protein [Solirubrobacteraceae bacterium]